MRNRQALDAITFRPEYLPHRTMNQPQLSVSMFGRSYDLPFGITPFGLSDLMQRGFTAIGGQTVAPLFDHDMAALDQQLHIGINEKPEQT